MPVRACHLQTCAICLGFCCLGVVLVLSVGCLCRLRMVFLAPGSQLQNMSSYTSITSSPEGFCVTLACLCLMCQDRSQSDFSCSSFTDFNRKQAQLTLAHVPPRFRHKWTSTGAHEYARRFAGRTGTSSKDVLSNLSLPWLR